MTPRLAVLEQLRGQRVRVNLGNDGQIWFIRHLTDVNVHATASRVELVEVEFLIDRDRLAEQLDTGKRNTHAVAVGYLRAWDDDCTTCPDGTGLVEYRPGPGARFTMGDTILAGLSEAWGEPDCRLYGYPFEAA